MASRFRLVEETPSPDVTKVERLDLNTDAIPAIKIAVKTKATSNSTKEKPV
jgi:hypothetical protein